MSELDTLPRNMGEFLEIVRQSLRVPGDQATMEALKEHAEGFVNWDGQKICLRGLLEKTKPAGVGPLDPLCRCTHPKSQHVRPGEGWAAACGVCGCDTFTPLVAIVRPYVEGDEKVQAEPPSFFEELTTLINRYSLENGSDTPDFILAGYLVDCLNTFNAAMRIRDKWYAEPNADFGLQIAMNVEPGGPVLGGHMGELRPTIVG